MTPDRCPRCGWMLRVVARFCVVLALRCDLCRALYRRAAPAAAPVEVTP